MGILSGLFKGSKEADTITLYSPAKGTLVDITKVSDETFAQKILGDGIAILPSDGKICSPCSGTVDNTFETGHAVSIVSDDGTEILIHAGIDTVRLKGEHFNVVKQTGDKVKAGDLLVEMDLSPIKEKGFDTTVVMVILNTDAYKDLEKKEGEVEVGGEVLRMAKNKLITN